MFLAAPTAAADAARDDRRPGLRANLERLRAVLPPGAVERAERVVRGEYQAYGDAWLPLPTGAQWQTHPRTGFRYPDEPWFRIRHVDAAAGDIKDTWEPARFGWVYDLIRGFAATGDSRFADAFWTRLEDFLTSNPAFRGVQWSDGQEGAIRAVAWLWAEGAFGQAATPERRALLCRALYASGERIADAINYALSQRNNHGLWECAGLACIGTRFLGAPRTLDWVRSSLKRFDRCVMDQFATDGWYSQHSLTYARVALQAAVMMNQAAGRVGFAFADRVVNRLEAGARVLSDLHDEVSGDVPNYGANDGANPLPLSSNGYRDFRPALTAFACSYDKPVPAPFTPDAETEAWLDARCLVRGERAAIATGPSGWVSTRVKGTHVFARAAQYRARPGHLDPLHIELWHDHKPVAVDAGSFRYSAPSPWNDGLRLTAVHNTIDIPALPIGRRGPGFLTLGVPSARVISATVGRFVLVNESWSRHRILHTREVQIGDDECVVMDLVTGPPGTVGTLHWLTVAAAQQPIVTGDVNLEAQALVVSEAAVGGWRSLYYAARTPAFSTVRRFVVPKSGSIAITSIFRLA